MNAKIPQYLIKHISLIDAPTPHTNAVLMSISRCLQKFPCVMFCHHFWQHMSRYPIGAFHEHCNIVHYDPIVPTCGETDSVSFLASMLRMMMCLNKNDNNKYKLILTLILSKISSSRSISNPTIKKGDKRSKDLTFSKKNYLCLDQSHRHSLGSDLPFGTQPVHLCWTPRSGPRSSRQPTAHIMAGNHNHWATTCLLGSVCIFSGKCLYIVNYEFYL